MQFSLTKSLEILERTPEVLQAQISGISNEWAFVNEGPETWSVFDITGHFVYIEKNNWMPRAQIILSDQSEKLFEILDPLGHLKECSNNSLEDLLAAFKTLRKASTDKLKDLQLTESDFAKTANHPALGTVTLAQLLATWVVHDLSHIAQISRVMAKQYKATVGPFSAYLRILEFKL